MLGHVTHTNFQHVSAGPRPPACGLAVACVDWAQTCLCEALRQAKPDGTCGATPAPEGGDEKRPNKVRMNCPIKIESGIFQNKL